MGTEKFRCFHIASNIHKIGNYLAAACGGIFYHKGTKTLSSKMLCLCVFVVKKIEYKIHRRWMGAK